ncbi:MULTISPECIES: hypothetical protein [Leptolyngbya]|uniref:hypothetical protein n=1 Tax=Leptolyngbya TaxID=47251 RepID=UPI00037E68EF|nr:MULTISPECIES: hypothetical protein [Leptolyngbya]MBD2373066.1 hypothetical protein [Leptolyngbya sp. FACHB-238]MBD2397179.1 hypothetical protein [Leptolyngbya sp. FACHB-239]MBD2404015.1 hypothetical protein [Leptolyngbya sp. FACHB-402]ULP33308.1 hypothetical protein MCP04_31570 [Leptolyngbya boryana IU 594]
MSGAFLRKTGSFLESSHEFDLSAVELPGALASGSILGGDRSAWATDLLGN